MESPQSFSLPPSEAVKVWRKYWPMAIVGLALGTYLNKGGIVVFAVASVVTAGVMFFLYRKSITDKWVTLSHEGISGRGQSNREVRLGWHDELVVEQRHLGAFPGIVISKVGVRATFVFVPTAILRLESFRASVAQFAEPNHPISVAAHAAT